MHCASHAVVCTAAVSRQCFSHLPVNKELLLLLLLLLLFAVAAAVGAQGLNPLPSVAMAANCTLGSIYGQITQDCYIYFPNSIGLILSESRTGATVIGGQGDG
jgi:uncharacterized ion transporter superfamily protein YfcC